MKKIILMITLTIIGNAELNINDFKANFVQTITTPKHKKSTYSGKISLKNNIFKWVYTKPTRKDICMNGKGILIVDHDLEQASYMNVGRSFDMLSILRKAKKYKENVYTTKIQGKTYTIQMHKNKLKYITFRDDVDNIVLINFKNLSEKNIKQEKCNYPANYDFIEE